MSENEWREIGFDIDLDYEGHESEWAGFLQTLDPQTACRLCGIDHFPHWLASAPNWQYLIEYLENKYPAEMPIREALAMAIKERRPDPKSEESEWWLAMKHVVPELEQFALLGAAGEIAPRSEAMLDDSAGWVMPAMRA